MLNSLEILTTLRDLIDAHALWPEVEQYGKRDRTWLDDMIHQLENGQVKVLLAPEQRSLVCVYPTTTLTTTQLHDLCFGAAIDEYALVNGEPVEPAATAWQRNLARHGVKYHMSNVTAQRVVEVRLDLTPEEWCDVGMQDGGFYRGGEGAMLQDIMNTAFRYSGWMSVKALQRFAALSQELDGTSSPCTDTSLLPRWFSRIERLSPWERLGCLWQLLAEQVKGSVP